MTNCSFSSNSTNCEGYPYPNAMFYCIGAKVSNCDFTNNPQISYIPTGHKYVKENVEQNNNNTGVDISDSYPYLNPWC
jgi:hypothetical protein